MLNVVCPHCNERLSVPDDLAQGHCIRCGQRFSLVQTQAGPPADATADLSQAIQEDAYVQPMPAGGETALAGPPERYASWAEFRAASPAVQREMLQLATRALPDLRRVGVQPIPEDAPAEIDDWGRPLGTIHVPGENRPVAYGAIVILLAITLLFMGLGVAAIFLDRALREGPNFEAVVTYSLLGVLFAALTGWVAFFRRSNQETTMWVFEEGVFLRRFGRSRVALWEQIQDFEASTETGRPLYWLTLSHDWSVAFSVGQTPEVVPLMEYIEIRLSAAQFLQRLEAIWRGRRVQFGVVALNREGFEHRWVIAPWSEVRRVVSDSQHLFLDWTQQSEWVPIRYQDVSFPYVVMAIAHVLIEDHSRLGPADA